LLPLWKNKPTPQTLQECVAEKQRIASEITAARSSHQEAETQKKLAETSEASLTTQIALVDEQKTKLTESYNSFSSTWMPLMTAIGTNEFVDEMNAALAKVDDVETDVNTYIAGNGAPAASGLPTALGNIRTAIEQLRDGVQTDLSNLQSLFTGSLMTVYPEVTNDLDKKSTDLQTKKAEQAQLASTAEQEANTHEAKISQLDGEWDAAVTTCEPLLKGESLLF